MYKKGDIVISTLTDKRFYIFCDQTDNLEVTLIDYDNPNIMTLGYVCFLKMDIEFSRRLKFKKIKERIKLFF